MKKGDKVIVTDRIIERVPPASLATCRVSVGDIMIVERLDHVSKTVWLQSENRVLHVMVPLNLAFKCRNMYRTVYLEDGVLVCNLPSKYWDPAHPENLNRVLQALESRGYIPVDVPEKRPNGPNFAISQVGTKKWVATGVNLWVAAVEAYRRVVVELSIDNLRK